MGTRPKPPTAGREKISSAGTTNMENIYFYQQHSCQMYNISLKKL